MKTVYFVRHGEAENNVRARNEYLGYTAALTGKGKRQAEVIAERATRLPVECLIASPWLRAKQTAELISEKVRKEVEYSELFIERRSPQSFLGKVWDAPETQKLEMGWLHTFYSDKERMLDGENFSDIKSRAAVALRYLEERSENTILVVTHGFFLRMIYAQILFGESLTPQEFTRIVQVTKAENTGITVMEFHTEPIQLDGMTFSRGWRLRIWNDHAHLG